jgi:hypothetical protein
MHGHDEPQGPQPYGIVAEFDDPDDLVAAARLAYKEGYRKLDAYSPFAIHGLAEAIGMRKTKVGLFTLIMGLTGAATGFAMQAIGMGWHYPYLVGGKPYFSWPAFIVITFECMILFAAFTCGISMLVLNGLPRPHHPIFDAKNFDRASSDRFFLCIEADDDRFNFHGTRDFLKAMQPTPLNVSEVMA